MQTLNTRFGEIEIDPETVLTFPLGMPGFEDCTRYKLLHEEQPNPRVRWLQSLDDADLSFSLVQVEHLGLTYEVSLSDEECALIELEHAEDAVLLLLLSRPFEEGREITANTQAPVVLNIKSRKALQKVGIRADIVFRS
ncbi:flagellar assembly protein FliW [Iodobacter sp. LRB]|uniref:flagellar assembly protein FliW n=1 Tax=unclassified Iodobacter TaxID=235634 RepID=UPI000C0DB8E7|nr:flagellar assembly protein FliW [Iodobacter sp. BJB302]PHV00067.1 flagellar biosynthesis protein FliW [Iodobacter sp. BJB302]